MKKHLSISEEVEILLTPKREKQASTEKHISIFMMIGILFIMFIILKSLPFLVDLFNRIFGG